MPNAEEILRQEQEKINNSVGGEANTASTIKPRNQKEEEVSKYQFHTQTDLITLPSQGIFYPNGEKTILVEFMTPEDENILTSPNLLQTGKYLDILLERKVKSKWINPSDLMSGDKNAIFNFLRVTAYGKDYTVNLIDPVTKEEFEYVVDLTKLDYKFIPDDVVFDINTRLFEYAMEDTRGKAHTIKFKLLTSKEEEQLYLTSQKSGKMNSNISDYFTRKLIASTVSVDGETDKIYIDQFITRGINNKTARAYNRYIKYCTPDVDYSYEVVAPSGSRFRPEIPINILSYFFSSEDS